MHRVVGWLGGAQSLREFVVSNNSVGGEFSLDSPPGPIRCRVHVAGLDANCLGKPKAAISLMSTPFSWSKRHRQRLLWLPYVLEVVQPLEIVFLL